MPARSTVQVRAKRTAALGWWIVVKGLVLVPLGMNAQTFDDPQVLYVGTGAPLFADMNHDGLPDGFIPKSDSLFLLINNGNGFDAPTLLTPLGPGTSVRLVVDLDSNGQLDVVFSHNSMDDQGVQHDSLGVIWLDLQPNRTYLDTTAGPSKVYTADMDGDSFQDLVYRKPSGVVVHFNHGDRAFTAQIYPSVAGFGGAVLGFNRPYDWDGDGDIDIMGGIGLNGNLAVSYNIDGELGYPFIEVDASINLPPQTDVLDLDADGIEDYIAANNAFLRSPAGGMEVKCCFGGGGQRVLGNVDCDPSIEIISPGYSDQGNGLEADLRIWDLAISGFVERRVPFDPSFDQFDMSMIDLNDDGLDDIVYRAFLPFTYDTLFYRINITTEPEVSLEAPSEVLPWDAVIPLTWGQPEGGLYSGPGVFDNTLHVALAHTNPLDITYTYSDPLTTCIGEASATLQTAVGIRSTDPADGYRVFPNPTSGGINFIPGTGGAVSIWIDDVAGRTLLEPYKIHMEKGRILEFPTVGLRDGLYFLNVEGGMGSTRLPFMLIGNGH
ncbi:MAG: T9SS type A sorting domain-containing protein [Flavobacteriales bacterium]|nr:T9SS type A sorting domain-containing protein [Flavobacteriales bacterium]